MVEQCSSCHEPTAYPVSVIDSHNPVHPGGQLVKVCVPCLFLLTDKEKEFRLFLANGPKYVGVCETCDYRSVSPDHCAAMDVLLAHKKSTGHTIAPNPQMVQPA